ncbi:hypothetical protein [Amycolatopsis echigonensis]|uniref:hypothetical protein n=1 Tax=Amycolatopsis echigonensis TaxID=2576905 RepID=UPI001304CE25|nr:hypothetical protein [Amycolatopsis niigatensis]
MRLEIRSAVGLEHSGHEAVQQIGLLAVAYSTQREFSPANRPPVDDIISFDGWTRQ